MGNSENQRGGVPDKQLFVYPEALLDVKDLEGFRKAIYEVMKRPNVGMDEMFPVLEEEK
ncbi:MAG: hypothetical protein ABII07_04135 [Patescibacteria group bacterium]|nr:hypothetical protein [Patescibacteria group bacterium]